MRHPKYLRRFESLEPRSLLAAGLLPIDFTIPIEQDGEFRVSGSATLAADVVILDPSDPSQLSITETSASGSGTLRGTFLGIGITGTYTVDTSPPVFEFTYTLPNLLNFVIKTSGTLDLQTSGGIDVGGTFVSTATGTINTDTRTMTGNVTLDAEADGEKLSLDIPFTLQDSIPAGLALPDASLGSIADRVFSDANNNGIQDDAEQGIGDITVTLLAISGNSAQDLESVVTDSNGFYSFYNLAAGQYAVRVDSLPDNLDLGKKHVGDDRSIDSDANSRTGQTDAITVSGSDHIRNTDIALRQVAREWQNPNIIEDVNDDGSVTALDALLVVNHVGRNEGAVSLNANRPIGSNFFDVSADGQASALDALRIINAIARIENPGESEGSFGAVRVNMLETDKDDEHASSSGLEQSVLF